MVLNKHFFNQAKLLIIVLFSVMINVDF